MSRKALEELAPGRWRSSSTLIPFAAMSELRLVSVSKINLLEKIAD